MTSLSDLNICKAKLTLLNEEISQSDTVPETLLVKKQELEKKLNFIRKELIKASKRRYNSSERAIKKNRERSLAYYNNKKKQIGE